MKLILQSLPLGQPQGYTVFPPDALDDSTRRHVVAGVRGIWVRRQVVGFASGVVGGAEF